MPGRDSYEETKDRLPRFWEAYPEGRVETEFVVLDYDNGRFISRTGLYRDSTILLPFSEGWCEEHYDPAHIVNKAYTLENCETGSIGRALSNGNFASQDHARATGMEMGKSERQGGSSTARRATEKQRKLINGLVAQSALVPEPVLLIGWPLPDDLSMKAASALIDVLQAEPKEPPALRRVPDYAPDDASRPF